MLQDRTSGERSQDQWSSGFIYKDLCYVSDNRAISFNQDGAIWGNDKKRIDIDLDDHLIGHV